MDTAAAFRLRYTLYTMHTAFIFHLGVSALTGDHKLYFLHTTDTDIIHIHGFHLPAVPLCIMYIHTINLCRKKCRFITACSGTDLHDNVFIIVRILGQQQHLQLLLQLFHLFLAVSQFFLQHLTHLFVRLFLQHHQGVFNILLALFIFLISLHDRSQVALLLHQLTEPGLVIGHSWLI